MKETEADTRRWQDAIDRRAYLVGQIRTATRSNSKGDLYHPDNIRARIAKWRGLLAEAEKVLP